MRVPPGASLFYPSVSLLQIVMTHFRVLLFFSGRFPCLRACYVIPVIACAELLLLNAERPSPDFSFLLPLVQRVVAVVDSSSLHSGVVGILFQFWVRIAVISPVEE